MLRMVVVPLNNNQKFNQVLFCISKCLESMLKGLKAKIKALSK
jgi:hypothetical protein